jgi:hypothetical protein
VGCDPRLDLTPVENCTKFYKCINNSIYLFNCPYGYLFDSSLRECQLANKIKCVSMNSKRKKRKKKITKGPNKNITVLNNYF